MTKHINLIADYNTDHLSYDSVTGIITNTTSGFVYDTANDNGYISINLKNRTTNITRYVKAHRIAWYLHTGTEPNIIDHQDCDRTNNKISNLISTTVKGNNQNKTRYKNSILMVGVRKNGNNFLSMTYSIRTGKKTGLGTYAKEEEAHYVATYYKVLHYANYKASDIAHIPNHPYHTGQLANIVSKITDTSGNSALVHLSK